MENFEWKNENEGMAPGSQGRERLTKENGTNGPKEFNKEEAALIWPPGLGTKQFVNNPSKINLHWVMGT